MKKYLIILCFLLSAMGFSQSKAECFCPKSEVTSFQKSDTIFSFSNNRQIALCGYKEIIDDKSYYSEFVISECGSDKIIEFWGATATCLTRFSNDKLNIETLLPLPLGNDYEYRDFVWSTETFYYSGAKLQRIFQINKGIKKYTQNQIQQVLKAFEKADAKLNDETMVLCNKLFVAAISNSEKARKYFLDFETKFGTLDGAFAEEYKDLKAKLALWNKR
ncbi:hypothetical protein FCR2A7T_13670 [Flavobacterium cauense R2A-7]|uniref:DUF4476 domain-containing protein n=1 Tax=Flavobacterium cauense R2A-7 TaxID=1341154 RepID=V6RZU4_9FLAO|nr:hypothetical protein [Flavobacterium cauense]ESU19958.1 hypothetical protein FCR2A7T_13670 [Flavobacterium cauense R2A-7]TWI12383.1 hypothetical protein IP98_01595 [Flavobacterium cauense R2A-7]